MVFPHKRFAELKTLTNAFSFFLLQVTSEHNLRIINSFHATALLLTPPPPKKKKYQETKGFLMFSRGIERDWWYDTGYTFLYKQLGSGLSPQKLLIFLRFSGF